MSVQTTPNSEDQKELNELALFAGAGGGILGGILLGWRTVCAVEYDAYARRVLLARQRDGCLPRFPIWDDVRTFDGRPWKGHVDVISGGFPCQDISAAGKGAGITGERSGLWREMARIIGEVGPRYVLVENSPMLTVRGLGVVLGDLASLGYDARWGVLGAHHAGAPHKRDRIWIVAHRSIFGRRARRKGGSDSSRSRESELTLSDVANTNGLHEQWKLSGCTDTQERGEPGERPSGSCRDGCEWWSTEPNVGRVAHGVASRVDRLRCIGNGQVPAVVRLAWEALK